MSVSTIGGIPVAAAAPPRRLLARVSDPLFQPGLAAFTAGTVKARLRLPTLADVLRAGREASRPGFDRLV